MEQIMRLTTAYKDIFTTVYLLRAPDGWVLFDAASYDEDVDQALVPFLQEAGVTADDLKYVFISHNHKDHSGGLARLLQLYPGTCVVSRSETLREQYAEHLFLLPEDGDVLLGVFRVVAIPGHTADSAGLLDLRTNTLISGDCLQLEGICGSGDWASNISYPAEHLQAIDRLRMVPPDRILTAHDYRPTGYRADGRDAVLQLLDNCVSPLQRLQTLILQEPAASDAEIRQKFTRSPRDPTVNVRVVAAMRAATEAGLMIP